LQKRDIWVGLKKQSKEENRGGFKNRAVEMEGDCPSIYRGGKGGVGGEILNYGDYIKKMQMSFKKKMKMEIKSNKRQRMGKKYIKSKILFFFFLGGDKQSRKFTLTNLCTFFSEKVLIHFLLFLVKKLVRGKKCRKERENSYNYAVIQGCYSC